MFIKKLIKNIVILYKDVIKKLNVYEQILIIIEKERLFIKYKKMTDRKQNHKFEPVGSSFDDSLVCKRCGKHPSKHRLYPTMGFIDAGQKTEVIINYIKSDKPWDYKTSLKTWLSKEIEFSKIDYAHFSDLMVLGVVEFDKDHCIYVLLPEDCFKVK